MAPVLVPERGDVRCPKPCKHLDCAAWRKFFDTPCRICGKPLLPHQKFYADKSEALLDRHPDKKFMVSGVHAVCLEEEQAELSLSKPAIVRVEEDGQHGH